MLYAGPPIACAGSFWGRMRGSFMRGIAMPFYAAIAEQKTRTLSRPPPCIQRFFGKVIAIKESYMEHALPLETLIARRPTRNDTLL